MTVPHDRLVVHLANALAAELSSYSENPDAKVHKESLLPKRDNSVASRLTPEQRMAEYDRRILDSGLRSATRSRYQTRHYSDAIEAGVKALNECVRAKSGSTLDGDPLMTSVFSEKKPKLRLNRLRTESEKSAQRGHMFMCQGVVAAWRNPRAHSNQFEDNPTATLAMLEHLQQLIELTNGATKTRQRN